jgi:hypothetical protein
VTRILRAGLAIAVPLLLMCAFVTPELVTSTQSVTLAATATAPASDLFELPTGPGKTPLDADAQSEDEDGVADLYGNEITPAVAKYSFDALGSLYELHSPQTELPRLGSPKS